MAKNNNNSEPQPMPVPSGGAPSPEERFITKEEAVAKSVFDEKVEWLEKRLKESSNLMNLVVAVLAIGFVTLLLAVLSILIQWWNFNANIQSELTKTLVKQNEILEDIKKNQNASISGAIK